jgi:hypothetical protein
VAIPYCDLSFMFQPAVALDVLARRAGGREAELHLLRYAGSNVLTCAVSASTPTVATAPILRRSHTSDHLGVL